jgi:hypothetical protein
MAQTQQPSYRAFTVIKREGQDDYWLPIGAAFPHQNGDGFNIVLQALPLTSGDGTCKIVLRPPKDDQKHEQNDDDRRGQDRDQQTKQAVRETNDRRHGRNR